MGGYFVPLVKVEHLGGGGDDWVTKVDLIVL
jgi:hypothetical protein